MTINKWLPRGIDDLEPAAWRALKHDKNACIVAGPGAGKTEFLAQKIAYLLENDLCPEPHRILAISFKKDAADNLKARVKERCAQKHSRRFDSLTFDAFTKSLVDRFRLSLPEKWRLKPDYDIVNFNEYQYKRFLEDMQRVNWKYASQIESIKPRRFQNILVGTHKLSEEKPSTLFGYLCNRWITSNLAGNVDFTIINRLADFIVRNNHRIARALALTYPYIVVDEFQDTTHAQYDFLATLLQITSAQIVVVGDNKQRIMTWAGAKPNSFEEFLDAFSAKKFDLQMNYRSSPALVKIHHILARSIDTEYKPTQSVVSTKVDNGVAEIWNFDDPKAEFRYLADWIKEDMKVRALSPEDYAILVRQRADDTHAALSEEFLSKGLLVCNESKKYGKFSLQDIVSDELFLFLSCLLRVAIQNRSAAAWSYVSQCMEFFFPVDYEEIRPRIRELLDTLVQKRLRQLFQNFVNPGDSIRNSLVRIMQAIGEETIRGAFPQHHSQVNFEMFMESIEEFFTACAQESNCWREFCDKVERTNQIPLMTVHKSKGMEYDTVLFLGLNDSAWWSYSENNPEGKSTFFVGLSRAKQRVIFTYSTGGRTKISELYSLLSAAGVPERNIE